MEHAVYLDNNATTQPLAEVCEAIVRVLGDGLGNPSSAHSDGDRARAWIRSAREAVAALIGAADPSSILFTSGATESNNMLLSSVVRTRSEARSVRIVTTAVEHSSVLKPCERLQAAGIDVVIVPVGHQGRIDLAALETAITPATVLVSVQWANNETGVIQPVAEISRLCRSAGVRFHIDAAQALGKIPIDVGTLPVDYMSLTAHKFHGPAGIGALYVRDRTTLTPLQLGGPQEEGLRPGTENLVGIVGFGTAAALRLARFSEVQQHLCRVRDHFESIVLRDIPDVTVNGDVSQRLCNTTNLQFAGVDGQALVARLDQAGVRCSQSSACTNRRPEPSYVLRAMGLSDEEAYASIRFSVGEWNTIEEVERAAGAIAEFCKRLRAFRTRYRNPYARPAEVH
jgi:cysteine desulfurase